MISKIKKIDVVVPIILLAIFGYIFCRNFFFSSKLDSSVIIAINDKGFFQDVIDIDPGTTVTWINKGQKLHWPASNFHPMHDLYPKKGGCIGSALDACRGLGKDEFFSFVFSEKGVWPIHDHLFPGLTMIVKVGQEKSSSLSYKEVAPDNFRSMDYATQLSFFKEYAEDNPALAWEFLKESFMVKGSVVGNAHEFSHIVGNTLYKKSGLAGIKVCDTAFAFGCMHGVTEAMLLKEGPGSVKSTEKQCLKFFPPARNLDFTGCIHGMGHGLYSFSGADLRSSLNNCDAVSVPYRNYCYDGVFMENSSSLSGRTFDLKNPWRLCSGLEEHYHQTCAKYQSQIFLSDPRSNSVENVGKNCALGPTPLLKEMCFQSLGYFVAQNNLGDTGKIESECATIQSDEGKNICTMGGAIETVFQRYGNWEVSSKDLCGRIAGKTGSTCFNEVERMIKENNAEN